MARNRYGNMFSRSINKGEDYMENYGKSRKLQTNEYIDDSGYIRRDRYQRAGSREILAAIILLLVLMILVTIIKFWIYFTIVGSIITICSLIWIFRRKKQ